MKGAQAANSPHIPENPNKGSNASNPLESNISPNSTPEMKEFMENRAKLAEKMQQWRSQNGVSNSQGYAEFQKENADLLKRQSQLAQIIAQQQARNPVAPPPPLQIPPNASPQLKAYLTTRDQLMRDQVAFQNQHRNDDPAVRQAAMEQWRQQNAVRFQKLQQEAQELAQQTGDSRRPVSQ